MELNHLRYFFEVAKAGSFTAASKALRVSQPALSKTVAQLEDREGVKLLDRGKKGVTLTPMGEVVYSRCELIFKEIRDLGDQMRGGLLHCEGPLKMGVSDHIANYLFPEIVYDFHQKNPRVSPDIFTGTPTEIVAMIGRREIELGVFFTRIASPQIEYETVGKTEFVTVYSPSAHQKVFKKATPTKDILKQIGFVGSRTADYLKQHPAQALLKSSGTDPSLIFETNNQELQKRLCKVGYGCAVLPRFMVEKELCKKELAALSTSEKMTADILVARRKGQTLSVPAQRFYEALKIALKKSE